MQLWLSGPGDAGELLAAAPAEARERTTVLGVGEAHEQAARYGRAWATVLPSTDDSFGMALIESQACGTPIVVSTHGAPQELVEPGRTGELCEPHDPAGFAAACAARLRARASRRHRRGLPRVGRPVRLGRGAGPALRGPLRAR